MILFTDNRGIKLSFQVIDVQEVEAIVGASIRPQYFETLKQISNEINVPFLIQPKTNEKTYSTFIEKLQGFQSDLFFINSYSMILKDEILRIPKKGTLNIHTSLLPKNRGSNPIQWGIINNQKFAGVSLHEVDIGIDTGPIVDQRKTKVFFNDTWLSISNRIDSLIIDLIRDNLKNILNFDFVKKDQDEKESNYNKRRKIEDGLFSWEAPVIKIYNLIRSLTKPLPGAYYFIGEEQMIIDDFLTISEVIFLKSKMDLSSFKLESNLTLKPDRTIKTLEQTEYDKLFSLPDFLIIKNKSKIGFLHFIEIDWNERYARIKIICKNKKLENHIKPLIDDLLIKELNLKLI